MSLYRSNGCGQCQVSFTCIMHDMSTHIINLFIGYVKNRVHHRRIVHAIKTGQRSMCCQVDAALLLVVHIPQHSSIALLYVTPLLTYTQSLPNTNHVLFITVSGTSMCTCARQLRQGFCTIDTSLFKQSGIT